MQRICYKCKKDLPIEKFSKSKSQNGYRYACKLCEKENKNNYYLERPWYKHLEAARRRCNSKTSHNYKWYGARGIKCFLTQDNIKLLWERDNAIFMKRPSIDRIDNDGNYELNNCRFIEQSENTLKGLKNGKKR